MRAHLPGRPGSQMWRDEVIVNPGFCLESIFQGPKSKHFQTNSRDQQASPFGRTVTAEGRLEMRERGAHFTHIGTGRGNSDGRDQVTRSTCK